MPGTMSGPWASRAVRGRVARAGPRCTAKGTARRVTRSRRAVPEKDARREGGERIIGMFSEGRDTPDTAGGGGRRPASISRSVAPLISFSPSGEAFTPAEGEV
jgi:hypothetical protein